MSLHEIKREYSPPYQLLSGIKWFDSNRQERADLFTNKIIDSMSQKITGINCDFGSGHCEVLRTLTNRNSSKWVGVDIVNGASRQKEKPELIVYNGKKLPFINNVFDNTAAISALHHIPDEALRENVLPEVNRTIRPDGYFIVIEDYIGGQKENPVLTKYIKSADTTMNIGVPGGHLMNQKTIKGWINLLSQYEFQLIKEPVIFRSKAAGILPWANMLMVYKKQA